MESTPRRPLLPETLRGRLTLWAILSGAVVALLYSGSLLLPEASAPAAGDVLQILFMALPLLYGRGGRAGGRRRPDGTRDRSAG